MSNLVDEVALSIRERTLFRRGQSILVAVSGGLDSMVLLHVLNRLAARQGWKLTVAHLNHQLRGRSSEADERLARRTAERLKLPIVLERADVRAIARMEKVSLEMASRKARHEFLARAAVQSRASTIALAHHVDDQLELFFLRLLRGSGSDGLAGMRWRNSSPANPKIHLVRPFMKQSKASLRQYAQEEKVPFREDATNASLDVQRNRIRHELLPLLRRKYQPALASVIARVMDITSTESEFVAEASNQWLAKYRMRTQDAMSDTLRRASSVVARRVAQRIARPAFAIGSSTSFDELPVAVQRRALQAQLVSLGIKPEYDLIEHLRLKPGKPFCVGQAGLMAPNTDERQTAVLRDATGLVHFRTEETPVFNREYLKVALDTNDGEVDFNEIRIQWHVEPGRSRPRAGRSLGSECFDADKVGSPILLRFWLPGDRFQPIGMSGSVKLQDFLTNQKIPRRKRHKLVLAVNSRGEVFWVEGLRISERFKLTQNTIRRLHWAWQKL